MKLIPGIFRFVVVTIVASCVLFFFLSWIIPTDVPPEESADPVKWWMPVAIWVLSALVGGVDCYNAHRKQQSAS
jgi:hypothetical protein